MNRVVLVLGLALLAAGLFAGYVLHVHSNGYDCGAPFGGAVADFNVSMAELQDQMQGGLGASGCDDARSSAKVLPSVLLILGFVVAVGSLFIPKQPRVEGS